MSVHTNVASVQNSLALIPVGQNDSGITAKAEMENGALSHAEAVVNSTKVVKDIKASHLIITCI